MYGFLRAHGSSIREQQCGLCRHYGTIHRTRARFLAGHDPSLLLMLVEGLAREPAPRVAVPCPVPFARARRAVDPGWPPLEAVAGVQLLFAGEKLFDDRVDRDGLGRVLARFYAADIAGAEARLRELGFPADEVRAALRRQPEIEADPASDLDRLSEPTAQALDRSLAWLARLVSSPDPEGVGRFGARLGRLLYLVDALHDLPVDLRRTGTSPLVRAVGAPSPLVRGYLEGTLEGRVAALERSFDSLSLERHRGELRVALVEGLAIRGRDALAVAS
jgi:hypothetical protein